MRARPRWQLTILLLFLLGSIYPASVHAQSEEQRYFPETGHFVTGEFLAAYDRTPNPELVYGNPITEAVPIPITPGGAELLVQYFERARFELHPEKPEELRVTLSLLGSELYDYNPPGDLLTFPANAPCRTFDLNGPAVCYAFLDFYTANGGIEQFGYPISGVEIHDGWMVQYFQRARFEWHPERPLGQKVVLTDIGSLHLQIFGDADLFKKKDFIPHAVLELQSQAFVESAVLTPTSAQTLFVVVQDQSGAFVTGANVKFILRLPDGSEQPYMMPPTKEDGISFVQIVLKNQPRGITQIFVTVSYQDLEVQTRTSYRIWP